VNDLATLNAKPRSLLIDGQVYDVHPLTLDEFGDMQHWVDQQFPDPFALAQTAIDNGDYNVAQQQFLLKSALEIAARGKPQLGTPEADAKVYSFTGVKELLYLSIRKGRPEWTREEAETLYRKLGPGQIAGVFDATTASMVLSDPKAEAPAGKAPTKAKRSSTTGGPSTASA